MYSDISIWIMESLSPNICFASILANKVLPTPVGPRNMNDPIGRLGSFKSARERLNALAITSVAFSCPITSALSSFSKLSNFLLSFCSIRDNGIPVQSETIFSIASSSTSISFSARSFFQSSMNCFCVSRSFFSSSRYLAASSNNCLEIASSFCAHTASISTVIESRSGGRFIESIRARAPASSRISMALSGRNLDVMYRSDSFTASSKDSSV